MKFLNSSADRHPFKTLALALMTVSSVVATTSIALAQPADPKVAAMEFSKEATLDDIHHSHLLEIKLATLGNEKSGREAVKAMSKHMIQDHEKADADLKVLAAKEKVDLTDLKPSDAEQAVADGLTKLNGAAFDLAYLDFQRQLHETLAGKLAILSKEEKDPQIKAYIDKILPTVKAHEKMASSLL